MNRAREQAGEYLRDSSITLETKREYIDHCFLLDEVFRKVMDSANCIVFDQAENRLHVIKAVLIKLLSSG